MPGIIQPNTRSGASDNIPKTKSNILHEYQHMIDWIIKNTKNANRSFGISEEDFGKYYTNVGEVRARLNSILNAVNDNASRYNGLSDAFQQSPLFFDKVWGDE